jgi:hypothetical protein
MSLRNGVVLPFVAFTLAFLAGCSSSGAPAPTPPPSGSFSVSDLKGTYVFSTSGSDPNGSFFTMAGIFVADGKGGISGGTIDINDSDTSVTTPIQAFGQSISSSSGYTVNVDGRGQIHFVSTPLGTITFAFVLNSTAGGLITEYDGNGSGSGTLELQAATITQQQMQQGYVFTLSGADAISSPISGAGAFSLDVNGTMQNGVHDLNDATLNYTAQALPGSVTLGADGGSGTATFDTSIGALNFNFYVVDATHIRLIETDALAAPVLSGDAFQQAAIPTGSLVFTMAGASPNGPLAFGGFMSSTAANQVSNGLEDVNLGTTVSNGQIPFTFTYIPAVNGRSAMALTAFDGGPTQLVIYPFTSTSTTGSGATTGLVLMELDANAVSSGVAYVQTNTALGVPPQGYALNLSAINTSSQFELDDNAEFATTSAGNLTGLLDENDQGSPVNVQAIIDTGSTPSVFQQDSPVTGRGEAQFNTSGSATLFDCIFYTVDGSNTLFMENDVGQVGIGSFQLQTGGSKSASSAARPLPIRPVILPGSALRHAKALKRTK